MKKSFKYIFVSIAVLLLLLISLIMIKRSHFLHKNTVSFEQKSFVVELAKTQAEREQGLMNREYLGENNGMLFVFENIGIYNFWMKNTLIPLDIIRINEKNGENRVVDIQTAQPCEIETCPIFIPSGKSKYVLEINAGLAEKYNIRIGDLVYLDFG